jgi:hypothetical protein
MCAKLYLKILFLISSLITIKPLFYDIPNSDGIINHYRILYNADFIEIYPTRKNGLSSGALNCWIIMVMSIYGAEFLYF